MLQIWKAVGLHGWTKKRKRQGYVIIDENAKIVAVGNAAGAEES